MRQEAVTDGARAGVDVAIIEEERDDRLAVAKIMAARGATLPEIKRVAAWVLESPEVAEWRLAVLELTYPRGATWESTAALADWVING